MQGLKRLLGAIMSKPGSFRSEVMAGAAIGGSVSTAFVACIAYEIGRTAYPIAVAFFIISSGTIFGIILGRTFQLSRNIGHDWRDAVTVIAALVFATMLALQFVIWIFGWTGAREAAWRAERRDSRREGASLLSGASRAPSLRQG
jgi:hypothetical protein